jgi:hypothetical protein
LRGQTGCNDAAGDVGVEGFDHGVGILHIATTARLSVS